MPLGKYSNCLAQFAEVLGLSWAAVLLLFTFAHVRGRGMRVAEAHGRDQGSQQVARGSRGRRRQKAPRFAEVSGEEFRRSRFAHTAWFGALFGHPISFANRKAAVHARSRSDPSASSKCQVSVLSAFAPGPSRRPTRALACSSAAARGDPASTSQGVQINACAFSTQIGRAASSTRKLRADKCGRCAEGESVQSAPSQPHGCCWEAFYMFAYCGLSGKSPNNC